MEDLKAKYPGLSHNRIPVCNSAAPLEEDFDTICKTLLGTNVNAPVIVNCQVTKHTRTYTLMYMHASTEQDLVVHVSGGSNPLDRHLQPHDATCN